MDSLTWSGMMEWSVFFILVRLPPFPPKYTKAGDNRCAPDDGPSDSDPLPEEVRAGLDMATVSQGERVRIKRHLAPGKLTIVEYYADCCGPCRLPGLKLERLVLRHENVALRRIEVSDCHGQVGPHKPSPACIRIFVMTNL